MKKSNTKRTDRPHREDIQLVGWHEREGICGKHKSIINNINYE